jgi:putative transposase
MTCCLGIGRQAKSKSKPRPELLIQSKHYAVSNTAPVVFAKCVPEEQIIGILKEHEAGVSVADLCRKHGVRDASIYKWKAKYGGMDVSEAKRLKTLEEENARLKRLLADAMLDNVALKDLLGKKW